MSFFVSLTEPAEIDLRLILRRMSKVSSPAKVDQWQSNFYDALESLHELPARCPLIKDDAPVKGLRQLLFDNYRIVFSIEDEVVLVIHIRHQHQQSLTADDF